MKKLWIASIGVVILGVGGFGLWHLHAANTAPPGFRTAETQRGTLRATISATGTIEPEEVVDVGAQVAGMIRNFGPDPRDSTRAIDYGTPVEKDTVLAEIDKALYQAQADQAKANLQRAEADLAQMQAKLDQAERDWNRARNLGRTRGALSDLDYDTVQATYLTTKSSLAVGVATIAQAQAMLKQAEINLGYCTIRSPVKGVIVDRRVNVGQTVVSSLNAPSLFLIAKDLTRLQIWASVNEADIGQIRAGQSVRFSVDAYPGETFKGAVSQVRLNATMTQNVVTYTVVVTTDNKDGKLLPYLTANLEFEVSQRANALLVPNSALRWRPQLRQVVPDARSTVAKYVQRHESAGEKSGEKQPGASEDQPGRGIVWLAEGTLVRPVKVRTGLSDGTSTEILGGDLQEGAAVVIGLEQAAASGSTTNPFQPQMFKKSQ